MDLEKAYDNVDRDWMWQVMRINDVSGKVSWAAVESVAFCRRYNLNGRVCSTTVMLGQ